MLILLLACVHRSPLPEPPPPRPELTLAPHGAAAAAARDALLFGDLATWARQVDTLLAPDAIPGADAERLATFQAAVAAGRPATTLVDAAAATGRIGVACGDCHASNRARITVTEEPAAAGDGVRAEMDRHARGLRLAWGGLVAASRPLSEQAVDAFEQGWLSPVSGGDDPAVQAMDAAVTVAAERFGSVRSPDEQAAAFGALVVACNACHATRPGGLRIEPE